ncbi:MAG: hypothetical protein JRH16_21805 [Deltaproteobacteria bacterium]|nr:hypothetical protein [Deltaproteobacteria bacterium]
MENRVHAIACAIALTALLAWPRTAQACSVCLAGDPVFDTHGTTVQDPGDFSVYVEVSGWRKKSGEIPGGHHEEEEEEDHEEEEPATEKNRSQRLDIYLSWAPLDRVNLTLDVPFAFNNIKEFEDGGTQERSHKSLGDLSLSASVVLWRNRKILPDTWIEGRAFLKFPTGESKQRVDGILDKHLQAGTGSWDFGFGIAGIHKFEWGSTYASLFGRINTEGSLDYEYGDVVLANLATLVPLGHLTGLGWLDRLTAGVEMNFRWADFDEVSGVRFRDSGGSILYATPSLRVRLPWFEGAKPPVLRAAVQLPLTSNWLNGFQKEYERWSVGLFFPF